MEITSPRELIAAIPHLLGFAPEDSLVITALTDNQVASMVRVDWPIAESVLAGSLARYSQTVMNCDVVLTFFGGLDGIDDAQVRQLFSVNDIIDVLEVNGDYWRSLICQDADCCPADGHRISYDTTAIGAEFVFRGSSPFASRDEMVQAIAADSLTDDERSKCMAAFARLTPTFDAQAEVEWFLAQTATTDVADWLDIARGARACQEIRTRDGLLRRAFESIDARVTIREWLIKSLRRVPESYVAAAATVLAGVVWLDGNGPLARIALDRALEADAEYSLAQLLDTALCNAVPSRIWSESLEAVSYEECLQGAA